MKPLPPVTITVFLLDIFILSTRLKTSLSSIAPAWTTRKCVCHDPHGRRGVLSIKILWYFHQTTCLTRYHSQPTIQLPNHIAARETRLKLESQTPVCDVS